VTTYDAYTPPAQPQASALLRPEALFASTTVVGLRAASTTVSAAGRVVSVWLYADPAAGLTSAALWSFTGSPEVTVTGPGTLVPAGVDPDGNPVPAHLDLPVAATGSALPGRAPYRLGLDPVALAGLGLDLDPLRRYLPVRLRPECGDVPDCITIPEQPGPLTPPDYDTLARDYTSLRATLLDRLAVLVPGADQSPADETVTLVELMAHLGDLLHYRLDRVSTEAWLPTARRRASVTRHARLVDFPVRPATSAAAYVQVHRAHANAGPGDGGVVVQPGDTATDASTDPNQPGTTSFTLELDEPVTVYASHGEVALYDWDEADAVLTAGAVSAVLVRPVPSDSKTLSAWLPVGSLLGLEVVSPVTAAAHHDWTRRLASWPPDDGSAAPAEAQTRQPLASYAAQVVQVTHVVAISDPLSPGLPLVRVFWDTPLARDVPVSIDTQAGTPRVGVARLGVFPAHHGLLVDGPEALRPLDPLTGDEPDPATERVSDYLLTRARPAGLSCDPGGRPWRLDTTVLLPNGVSVDAPRVTSLLRAPDEGFSVVVDHDDDAPPRLRFRTGALGTVPPTQSVVGVRYQVGSGPDGMVAANTLTRLVRTASSVGDPCEWADVDDRVHARNLTPGVGGTPATPLDDVRRDAPEAYAAVPRRAVLVSDLPAFATQVPGVDRAAARRSWSGSWPVGLVSVETDTDVADEALDADVANVLDGVRMAGTEVVALPATPVGLLVALTVCLTPGTDPGEARLRILAALRPGRPGAVFAPAALALGTSVYLSTVVAAVAAVPGVDAVRVTEARRLSEPAGTTHEVIEIGASEIAVCDDDAAAPDRGRIELTVEGGR
jgi:hypothetical protein